MDEGLRTYADGRGWIDRPQLGATLFDDGVLFAVFSEHAHSIEVCFFDEGGRETGRMPLGERAGNIWYGFARGAGAGTRYGFRAHGPDDPAHGHRFNPRKLLIDPYARSVEGALRQGAALSDRNKDDSAPFVPKAVVPGPEAFNWSGDEPPRTPFSESVLYEAHVKSLTALHPDVPAELRGTYEALACPAILDHLTGLGVTAVELLPVHAFADEAALVKKGLRNHWGYNSYGFFAPEPRYFGPGGADGLRAAIKALHAAGIEVILDVVYNHTAESGPNGPTLMFRGLDNLSYYRLEPDGGYINDTGCGNTLRCDHPMVMRLILDSLRYWVTSYRVDGFRFDLATVLGRSGQGGFDPAAPLLHALLQDPVLAGVKLIAEPWDVGPGGYQLGAFPPGYAEWNDRFRDDVRMFWRGDKSAGPALAARLLGSAERFDLRGRRSWSSVNTVSAHDGFTLSDLVSYLHKHNHANGEGNRDGHANNHSSNAGVEGPSDDPVIRSARDRRRRNLMATLLLSQGTPMLLAGDEIGNSQGGNNNAYCQDNETSWVDWDSADGDFLAFVTKLLALRRGHPSLRQSRFLHGGVRADGAPDVTWLGFGGGKPDWSDPECRQFAVRLRGSADAEPGEQTDDDVLIAVNGAGDDAALMLPEPSGGGVWCLVLSTQDPQGGLPRAEPGQATIAGPSLIAGQSLSVFCAAGGSEP